MYLTILCKWHGISTLYTESMRKILQTYLLRCDLRAIQQFRQNFEVWVSKYIQVTRIFPTQRHPFNDNLRKTKTNPSNPDLPKQIILSIYVFIVYRVNLRLGKNYKRSFPLCSCVVWKWRMLLLIGCWVSQFSHFSSIFPIKSTK